MYEQVRSLAIERLSPRPFGSVPAAALRAVEDSLRLLLTLGDQIRVNERTAMRGPRRSG